MKKSTTSSSSSSTLKLKDKTNKANETHNKCNNTTMATNAKIAIMNNCKDIVQNELKTKTPATGIILTDPSTTTSARNHYQHTQYYHHHHHQHQHHVQLPPEQHQSNHHQHSLSQQQLQSTNQLDKMSIHSISSEDISTTVGGKCCSAAARNPAIKTGRRIQLMQVSRIITIFF